MSVLDRIKSGQSELMILDVTEFNGIPGKVQSDSSDVDELLELAEVGDRMRWISVKEGLPKDSRRMWVHSDFIYVARFDLEKQMFYDIEGSLLHIGNFHKEIKNVTHYMLVPPSPVDEN